jgi:hypothetical protein
LIAEKLNAEGVQPRTSHRVHLLTDGAAYRLDGTITHFTQKVRTIPHINAAVAMRGAALGFAPIMEEIQAAKMRRELARPT